MTNVEHLDAAADLRGGRVGWVTDWRETQETGSLFTMPRDEAHLRAYCDAYERWQRDLQHLHRVFLDGEALETMHRVALLRSESHSHDRYESARRDLLGLSEDTDTASPFTDCC